MKLNMKIRWINKYNLHSIAPSLLQKGHGNTLSSFFFIGVDFLTEDLLVFFLPIDSINTQHTQDKIIIYDRGMIEMFFKFFFLFLVLIVLFLGFLEGIFLKPINQRFSSGEEYIFSEHLDHTVLKDMQVKIKLWKESRDGISFATAGPILEQTFEERMNEKFGIELPESDSGIYYFTMHIISKHNKDEQTMIVTEKFHLQNALISTPDFGIVGFVFDFSYIPYQKIDINERPLYARIRKISNEMTLKNKIKLLFLTVKIQDWIVGRSISCKIPLRLSDFKGYNQSYGSLFYLEIIDDLGKIIATSPEFVIIPSRGCNSEDLGVKNLKSTFIRCNKLPSVNSIVDPIRKAICPAGKCTLVSLKNETRGNDPIIVLQDDQNFKKTLPVMNINERLNVVIPQNTSPGNYTMHLTISNCQLSTNIIVPAAIIDLPNDQTIWHVGKKNKMTFHCEKSFNEKEIESIDLFLIIDSFNQDSSISRMSTRNNFMIGNLRVSAEKLLSFQDKRFELEICPGKISPEIDGKRCFKLGGFLTNSKKEKFSIETSGTFCISSTKMELDPKKTNSLSSNIAFEFDSPERNNKSKGKSSINNLVLKGGLKRITKSLFSEDDTSNSCLDMEMPKILESSQEELRHTSEISHPFTLFKEPESITLTFGQDCMEEGGSSQGIMEKEKEEAMKFNGKNEKLAKAESLSGRTINIIELPSGKDETLSLKRKMPSELEHSRKRVESIHSLMSKKFNQKTFLKNQISNNSGKRKKRKENSDSSDSDF